MNATVTAVTRNFRDGSGLNRPVADGATGFDLIVSSLDDGSEHRDVCIKLTGAGLINVGDRINVSDPVAPAGRRRLGAGVRIITR